MTKAEKIALLEKIEKYPIEDKALRHVMYLCDNCDFKITITDRKKTYISCEIGNSAERALLGIENVKNEYSHLFGTYWQGSSDDICLDCGSINIIKRNDSDIFCEYCSSRNVVFWQNLAGKKCPACNFKLSEGKEFDNEKDLDNYGDKLWKECVAKAMKKHGIEKSIIKEMTEEEEKILKKKIELYQFYLDSWYVINRNHNIIKFCYQRSFHPEILIIVEWEKEDQDGKLTFVQDMDDDFNNLFKEIKLDNIRIKTLLSILEKYNFFVESNEIDRMGLDGSIWQLEVQHNEQFKEINVWSPKYGVIYDIGKLLIEYSEVEIEELY